jgi:hypothetical protein
LITAVVAFTVGFQPEIEPSSVTQMKMAGLPGASRKSVVLPLNITAVGFPNPWWPGAGGTVTTVGRIVVGVVETSYSVEVPVKLFEIHHGVDGPCTSPQAFRRFESGTGAAPVLETRLVCV